MLDGILETLGSTFDPHVLWEYRVVLLSGLLYNFYVFFLTIGFAICLGLIAAVLRLSSYVALRGIGTAYAEICRNTPEYIALIWIFYVPPLLLSMAMNENISFSPVLAAVIALALTYSGYFTETFRAGSFRCRRATSRQPARLECRGGWCFAAWCCPRRYVTCCPRP